jgi:hypothetical protein
MTTQMSGLEAVTCATGPWDRFGTAVQAMMRNVEPILARYDVGVGPRAALDHLRRAAADVATLKKELRGAEGTLPGNSSALPCIHRERILARIFGAALITSGYAHRMSEARRREAFAAQVLFEAQQDILDDLLDDGGYTFGAARNLYRLCSELEDGPMATRARLEAELTTELRPEHRAVAPILASISTELAERLRASPRSAALAEHMAMANEALGDAQAATVFLRETCFDLGALKAHGQALWSPDPCATWADRLAAHAAWVGNVSLIDLCFVDSQPSAVELEEHRAAWFDLNMAMSYFDHVAGIGKDRNDGIINFAASAVADAHGVEDSNRVSWTRSEMQSIIERTAEAASRGIDRAQRSLNHNPGFYPLLAAMSAIVLTAEGTGNETWCLPQFLGCLQARSGARPGTLGPARGGDVTQVRFTTPPGIRSTGLLAGRTSSS